MSKPQNKSLKTTDQTDKLLYKILENQTQELAIKQQEIEAQTKHDNNALEFAKTSIKAQGEESTKQIDHHRNIVKMRYWLVSFIIVVITTLVIYPLAIDNGAFALEIIKVIVFLGAGGMGGYGYCNSKRNNS